MKTGLWSASVVVMGVLAFLLGYAISSQTGIEPGYFESAEGGGYGAPAAEGGGTGGVGAEMEKYYKDLKAE
ncbi:MAG: hypothetical protein CMM10_05410 [Rhodospirillaceae bacterium]|jgi:hypothetical protein|nr:hypothetical protein [Rhodospirillaceae bacterium]|tara:strand:- start:288 stop:500 length:213 start_codon:yes stop_codon:yes gene_type:complete